MNIIHRLYTDGFYYTLATESSVGNTFVLLRPEVQVSFRPVTLLTLARSQFPAGFVRGRQLAYQLLSSARLIPLPQHADTPTSPVMVVQSPAPGVSFLMAKR